MQISTTNLMYYLLKHDDIRAKLMAEIRPPVEAVKDRIVDGLEYDTVMELDYLRQCWSESIRLEPPSTHTMFMTVDKTCTIGKGELQITLKKGAPIAIVTQAIH